MKLTKQAIAKLMDPVNRTSRIVNDAYREVTATAKFNNYKIEIRVAVVHPLLQDKVILFRGERVTMIYWVERSGDKIEDIPDTLAPVIEELRNSATMSREEALGLCIGMHNYFGEKPVLPAKAEVKVSPEEQLSNALQAVDTKPTQAPVAATNVVELKVEPAPVQAKPEVVTEPERIRRTHSRVETDNLNKKYQSTLVSGQKVWISPAQQDVLELLKKGKEVPRGGYQSLLLLEKKGLVNGIVMGSPHMIPGTSRVQVGFKAHLTQM